MSITDNYQPDKSLGNGVTAIFTGSWKVLNADYFQMRLENVVTGVQTLLTRGVDYSLTFNDAGYTATFLGSPPTSANYVIRSRQVTLDQIVPYRTSKGFQGEVQENSFDKLTAIEQDQQDQIDRSLKFKIGSSSAGYEIEDPINGRGLMWDTVNNRIVNTDTDIDTIVADVEAAVIAAQASAVAAAGSQAGAATSATASEDWAKKINGSVDGSEYSSKAYAIGGVGVTNGVGRGAAKEWATKTGSTVDGTEYSAKKYAADAQGYAAAAAAAAAEGLYNNVDTITFANSPFVPLATQEGWLFRCDTTSGNMVINLSALSVYGQDMKFGFVKVDNSANTITINRGGTDTINGATSAVISTQFETHVIIGDLQTGTWIDTVQTTGVPNGSITNAKLANMAANTVKVNDTAGSAAPNDLALSANTVLGRRGGNIIAVPIGTGANNLVSLDASSKLPAVDGSQLTGIPNVWVEIVPLTTVTAGATVASPLVHSNINPGNIYKRLKVEIYGFANSASATVYLRVYGSNTLFSSAGYNQRQNVNDVDTALTSQSSFTLIPTWVANSIFNAVIDLSSDEVSGTGRGYFHCDVIGSESGVGFKYAETRGQTSSAFNDTVSGFNLYVSAGTATFKYRILGEK